MNWFQPSMKVSAMAAVAWILCSCGVKGDPLPPETPVELGRGRPTYRGAAETLKVDRARRIEEDKDKDKEDEDREDQDDEHD